jgi:putative redox protein
LITNGRHIVVGDEPKTSAGTDLGFSPEDLICPVLQCAKWLQYTLLEKNNWTIGEVDERI